MNCGISPIQCSYIWNDKYDPQYTHGPWTRDEYKIFTSCVKEVGDSDDLLDVLSLKIPCRSRFSIYRRIYNWKRKEEREIKEKGSIERKRLVSPSDEEIYQLREIVKEEKKKEIREVSVWKSVAKRMQCGYNAKQLFYLWNSRFDPEYTHGMWTNTERVLFEKCVTEVGFSSDFHNSIVLLDALRLKIPWRNRTALSSLIRMLKIKIKRYAPQI
jgi:hypothetical protein